MSDTPPTRSPRWAPWYHYVFALAVTNALAQLGLRHTSVLVNAASTIALDVAVAGAVTWGWRSTRPR